MATESVEAKCADGVDSDCDGFVDCLDSDCDGSACGDGLSCLAGACLGSGALPELPRIENLSPIVRGDTATISFEPVLGALDYRIYPLPADDDVLVGADGEVVVKNAIYRCSGAQPRKDRREDEFKNLFPYSLSGNVNGYVRTEAESVLGHVFLGPGPDRVPVYRMADPNSRGGYAWEYDPPPAKEYNGADYVATAAERDALLALGYRDDGIAFYAPTEGAVTVYRRKSGDNDAIAFYTDGPEKTLREGQAGEGGARFQVLDAAADGSVPLYRIFYGYHNDHDNLAAGDANKERVLNQGQAPVTVASWPGLSKGVPTTLVIEALDQGCPFPGGYISATAAPAAELGGVMSEPAITLDDARSKTTGEVFINGQFEPKNRPKPIARGYVTVEPKPHPQMDWFQSFDPDSTDTSPEAFTNLVSDNIGTQVWRNDKLSLEFENTNANFGFGSQLGQFLIGSSATFAVAALDANAQLGADGFLHATMSVDLASTMRRYPQIVITTAPLGDPEVELSYKVPFMRRLGPVPDDNAGPGPYSSIIAQPFGGGPEIQVEFCDRRGWGVSAQCPKANVYGAPAGAEEDWTAPWLPLPNVGEYVGLDRLAKVDVYASTNRVYVFLEDRPAGCAVLPAGKMPAGPVNVIFGVAGYHIEIDEFVTSQLAPAQYWSRYSVAHIERKMDDLGIESGVALPAWDEQLMPCGDHYYAGILGK